MSSFEQWSALLMTQNLQKTDCTTELKTEQVLIMKQYQT